MSGGIYYTERITPEMAYALLEAFLSMFLTALFIGFAVSAVLFVLKGIGLFKMAKTLNISGGWMAFVPFFSDYMLGKVGESYKKAPAERFSGMGLAQAVSGGAAISASAVYIVTFFKWLTEIIRKYGIEGMDSDMAQVELLTSAMSFMKILFVCAASAVCYAVLSYISVWRVFKVFIPLNATAFLVLSIFIPFLMPVFIFAVRNNIPGPEEKKPEYPDIIYT